MLEQLQSIAETNKETDERFVEEYKQSFKRFVSSRAVEEFPSKPADVAEQLILDRMQANYALLEPLYEDDSSQEFVSSMCTITIPVAILSEDIDSVVGVVDKIQRSRGNDDTPLDIVVWANAKYSQDSKEEVERESLEKYAQLSEKLKLVADEGIRIKTALQVIHEDNFSMSKLRSHYMDAVMLDSAEKGYGFNHPVLWLDADTTAVSKGSIATLSDAIENTQTLFVHANLRYSVDWSPDTLPKELDDATKAVIINEMQQRYLHTFGENDAPRTYAEESGLMFALGVYMNAGGLDTVWPIGESSGLIYRARKAKYGITGNKDGILPPSIDKRRGLSIPILKYVQSARMNISARRHYEVAKRDGTEGLFDVDESGYGKKLYTDIEKGASAVEITNTGMKELSNRNHAHWEKHKTQKIILTAEGKRAPETEEQLLAYAKKARNKKIVDKLIDRYFVG